MGASPYDGEIAAGDIEAPLTEVASEHVPQGGVHLYHLSMSYYSQIARLALEEAGVRWVLHPVRQILLPVIWKKVTGRLGKF